MVSAAPLTESSVRFRGDGFSAAREALLDGGVALLPTDTVYGLAVHPRRPDAIDRLFALKDRPRTRNLPIMVATPDELPALGVLVTEAARRLLAAFSPGPAHRGARHRRGDGAPSWLAGRDEIGVRVPADPDLRALLSDVGPLLVTSANAHGEPTPQAPGPILAPARGAPDAVVDGGVRSGVPSTVVNCHLDVPRIEREGAVPAPGIERVLGASGATGEERSRMTAVLPADGLMLGIETSCDDTGVAVVRPDGEVVAAAVASQVELHDRYGGVYPEMASRAHVDAILPTVRKVLDRRRPAPRRPHRHRRHPRARADRLARRRDQQRRRARRRLGTPGLRRQPPARAPAQRRPRRAAGRVPGDGPAGLGRPHAARAPAGAPGEVQLVGSTRDDSVGEAYDKVARMLGLRLPGRAGDRQAGQDRHRRTCPSRARRWTSSWTSPSRG